MPRSNLLQAQAEVKANQEEKQTLAESVARLQAQVNDGRLESAKLQAEMSGMVPRTTYEAAKRLAEDVEAAAESNKARLEATIHALNEKLSAVGDEKSHLIASIQVLTELIMRFSVSSEERFEPVLFICREWFRDQSCMLQKLKLSRSRTNCMT